MQKLASENMKIRITGAEIETKPGTNKTQMVPLVRFEEGKTEGKP